MNDLKSGWCSLLKIMSHPVTAPMTGLFDFEFFQQKIVRCRVDIISIGYLQKPVMRNDCDDDGWSRCPCERYLIMLSRPALEFDAYQMVREDGEYIITIAITGRNEWQLDSTGGEDDSRGEG
ncbi:hypothetical protein OPV22_034915 [Ensete ventricosum]|uniref:Uncharacterized protein n=1 Tax=Ensete ventricosum TaxID=4639 RepID=A0AAV8PS78_ENSVE|nr:hypothetical protein OPV22_034915 [Ensete ventricosum]